MILRDFHVHTTFCDGSAPPEEMVKAAIAKGIKQLGIVAHSYVPFDTCCIPAEKIDLFRDEITALKTKHRNLIELFCGIEMDLFSPQSSGGFDYTIGSVHYLKQGERYISVDETPEILRRMIDEYYDGDFYLCAEDYYRAVAKLAEMKPTIIGHFDLIKKFSSAIPINPADERYRAAWRSAADALLGCGATFEVNTGGISRGWLNEPYPSAEICEYIKAKGGKLILSSDAHAPENLAFEFVKWQWLI